MRFHELFEYHRKNSAKKWKTALAEISPTTDPEETLKKIEKGDPTNNKTYMQWIISQLRENPVLINDMNHMYDLLKSYEDYKPRLPKEHKRIDQLNYQQVFDIIDKIDNPEFGTHDAKKKSIEGLDDNEYEELYSGPYGNLYVPKTENAACVLGRGTKWCTAATTSNNAFNIYAKIQGNLYYWRDKTGKYAFRFETIEFKDEQNIDIDWDILKNWHNHAVLKHLFKEGEKHLAAGIPVHSLDDIYVLKHFPNYVFNVMDERLSKNPENIFLNHVKIKDVIKYVKKYPESANIADKAILNKESSEDAILYNRIVRKNERWPEFEQVLFGSIEKRLARKKTINFLMQSTEEYAKDILGIKLSQWKEFMKLFKKYDKESYIGL